MSLFYRILYQIGFTPWEEGATDGPAAKQIARLFEREERERGQPYGPALDLGCGSGIWSVILARRARPRRQPPGRGAGRARGRRPARSGELAGSPGDRAGRRFGLI